ncbi:hypothetical protein ACIQU5_28030 [Streptomyces sp. NPDC090306]|uniref:hypothetical protein n=1 Tax=Streptomyces sp. NPDC090306 TaxID=3365961 RepID=UPI0037FFFF62
MNPRRIIDAAVLMDRMLADPALLRAVHRRLRLNGIQPADVPADSEIALVDGPFGLVIQYERVLRDASGHRYRDESGTRAAAVVCTALLSIAPPADWCTGGTP